MISQAQSHGAASPQSPKRRSFPGGSASRRIILQRADLGAIAAALDGSGRDALATP